MHIEIMYVTDKLYEKKLINPLCTEVPTYIYFDLFENVHNTFFQHLELVFNLL